MDRIGPRVALATIVLALLWLIAVLWYQGVLTSLIELTPVGL